MLGRLIIWSEVQRQLVDIVLSGGGVAEVAEAVSELFSGVALVTTAGFGYAAVSFVGIAEGWEDVARSLRSVGRRRREP